MTREPDDGLPTPGPNEPVPAWPEYRQLRETVHDYLDHDPDDQVRKQYLDGIYQLGIYD